MADKKLTNEEKLAALNSVIGQKRARVPRDLDRILALPEQPVGAVPDVTRFYKKRNGKMTLYEQQSWMLLQAAMANGLIAAAAVGAGKALVSFLLPWVFKAQRPLLVIPAFMRAQCENDWHEYSRHFNLPRRLRIRSYSQLSQPGSKDLLFELDPDCIIADECHKLKNRAATCTKRVDRYLRKKPHVKFAGLSGTISTDSLLDFAHLLDWALGEGSPLPSRSHELNRWAAITDISKQAQPQDYKALGPLVDAYGPPPEPDLAIDDRYRTAIQKRIITAPGVVSWSKGLHILLTMKALEPTVPEDVQAAIEKMSRTWVTPSGEEIDSGMMMAQKRAQLVCGLYSYWDWPGGEPDEEWLDARATWSKAVRKVLKAGMGGCDSPKIVENACKKQDDGHQAKSKMLPDWCMSAYRDWQREKVKPKPPTKWTFISPYLVDYVVEWARAETAAGRPPLIWYKHEMFGRALAARTRWPLFGAGSDAGRAILAVKEPIPCIVSISAHGTGKNLQLWGNNLVAHPMSSATGWEQLLGRTHRNGQLREEVLAHYFRMDLFQAAMQRARAKAKMQQQLEGNVKRLCTATFTHPVDAKWTQRHAEIALRLEGANLDSEFDDDMVEGVEGSTLDADPIES